jgi:hypothetical protein
LWSGVVDCNGAFNNEPFKRFIELNNNLCTLRPLRACDTELGFLIKVTRYMLRFYFDRNSKIVASGSKPKSIIRVFDRSLNNPI